MIYISVVLTVFCILVLLLLWGNVPNKREIELAKRQQEEHNEYQKKVNAEVLQLHRDMLGELRYQSEQLEAIRYKTS